MADNEYRRKCRMPIVKIDGVYVVLDSGTTADGLTYCPPNPDHRGTFGSHQPQTRKH
jgi:hypothetical protein